MPVSPFCLRACHQRPDTSDTSRISCFVKEISLTSSGLASYE